MPNANQVEFISAYADTAIKAYIPPGLTGIPNVFLLEKGRFSPNGTVISQKSGTFTTEYFPILRLGPSITQPIQVNGQKRLVLATDQSNYSNSAVLLFDTAFNFIKGIEIPGRVIDMQTIALKENTLGWLASEIWTIL